MKKIFFATTSEDKINEAKSILNIEIEGSELEIEEIQSLDIVKVATRKALDYYDFLKKPVLVEDVSLTFKSLNSLPGTYIKDFSKALGNDGLAAIIPFNGSRDAVAKTVLAFVDEKGKVHIFEGKVEGKISEKPKGEKGFGWDAIFIPKGEKRTFAEMDIEEKNKYSMRAIALTKFKEWLDENKLA